MRLKVRHLLMWAYLVATCFALYGAVALIPVQQRPSQETRDALQDREIQITAAVSSVNAGKIDKNADQIAELKDTINYMKGGVAGVSLILILLQIANLMYSKRWAKGA